MDEKICFYGDEKELNPCIEECSVQECIKRWKDKWYQRFNERMCVSDQPNFNDKNESYILIGESHQNILVKKKTKCYLSAIMKLRLGIRNLFFFLDDDINRDIFQFG